MRTFPIKVLGLVVRESSLLGVNVFAIECMCLDSALDLWPLGDFGLGFFSLLGSGVRKGSAALGFSHEYSDFRLE